MRGETTASEKIRDYYALHPFRFDMVERLELVASRLLHGFTTQLVMHCVPSKKESKAQTLVLNFAEIQDLKLQTPGAPFQTFLDIRDISDRQWEEVKYHVLDNQNGTISFPCNDFSFRIEEST